MNMTPRFQKFALLAHIAFSVGWFGAVIPYFVLAIAGLVSRDVQIARASFLSMELIGWYVIVPLSIAALLSGLVQSLATQWGLFRYWWLSAKFLLTIIAVVILLQHMRGVSRVSRMVKESMLSADFRPELVHAAGGLLVLLAVMTLSVFKPWGMTPWSRRQTSQASPPSGSDGKAAPAPGPGPVSGSSPGTRLVGLHVAHIVALVLLFAAILHIIGGHHH